MTTNPMLDEQLERIRESIMRGYPIGGAVDDAGFLLAEVERLRGEAKFLPVEGVAISKLRMDLSNQEAHRIVITRERDQLAEDLAAALRVIEMMGGRES